MSLKCYKHTENVLTVCTVFNVFIQIRFDCDFKHCVYQNSNPKNSCLTSTVRKCPVVSTLHASSLSYTFTDVLLRMTVLKMYKWQCYQMMIPCSVFEDKMYLKK